MRPGTIYLSQIAGKLCPNGHKSCLSAECWLQEETMRQQAYATFKMLRYRMEPGDGTRYEFFIAPLDTFWPMSCINAEGRYLPGHPNLDDIITGVERDEFVILGICMPSGQGVYEVGKFSLRNPTKPYVDYLMGHMPGVSSVYTVAAILLACSVLVDEPANLAKATEAMLRAPELLEE